MNKSQQILLGTTIGLFAIAGLLMAITGGKENAISLTGAGIGFLGFVSFIGFILSLVISSIRK